MSWEGQGVSSWPKQYFRSRQGKTCENALFLHIFQKFNKQCVIFSRVLTKNINCWKFLKSFNEISIENWIFNYFLENKLLVQQKFKKIHYRLPISHILTGGGVSKQFWGCRGAAWNSCWQCRIKLWNFFTWNWTSSKLGSSCTFYRIDYFISSV